MKPSPHATMNGSNLRERAESRLAERPTASVDDADLSQLVHELRVHQAELELQNEELRQAERALTASRDHYHLLYDHAPVGFATLDATGHVFEANATLCRQLGCPHRMLVGRPLSAFMSQAHGDAFYLHIRAVLVDGHRRRCELELQGSDGVARRVQLESTPNVEVVAQSRRVLTSIVDLTDLRHAQHAQLDARTSERHTRSLLDTAEQRRRASEAILQKIAAHVDDVFYVRELDKRLSYVSPAFATIWGRSVSDVTADPRGWLESIDPRDQVHVHEAHQRLQRGEPIDVEYRIHLPDGTTRWIRDHASAERDEAGHVLRLVGVARDVSEWRRLEDELRQASKLDAIDTLAAGIAHDFRNLLHGIAGIATLAARHPELPEPVAEYLGQIRNATRRGTALIDQLTAFSRRQDADEPRPIVLDAFIEGSAPLLMRLVGEQVRVTLRLGAPGAAIMADPVQLERIVMNLASNALDAMPQGGALELRTEAVTIDEASPRRPGPSGAGVRLVVRDTGIGMDDATRARIFEPFFTTKGIGKGTGLGLSAVFGITRKLGGTVEVDSEPGVGTSFTFWLPRCSDAQPRPPSAPHVVARLSGVALLVEDDALVRASIHADLEQLGMQVVEAADPLAALALAETLATPPTLLVSDVMMPHMTGARLSEQLRARFPALQVLLVSAHAAEDLVGRGTLPPGARVLRKPFDQAALAQHVLDVVMAPPVALPVGPLPDVSRGTILLVDDDEDGRVMMAALLEHHGLQVLTAGTPAAALRVASEWPEPIDLLITDIGLPQMSGDELARQLRAQRPSLMVLFVSGSHPTTEVQREGESMLKPVDLDQLVARVRSLLEHPRVPSHSS